MLDNINSFIQKSLLENETVEKRSLTFRGSNLPICPRKLMFGQFQKQAAYKTERNIPFTERYHYHVGRAIHSLVQETWGEQGLLWGDFHCKDLKNCGARFTSTRLEGGRCHRCGSPCLYVEKRLVDSASGFSGHCDAPVFFEKANGYLVFEVKSRNSNIIAKAEEPYLSDIYQVSLYATLLARQHWLRIVGRVVLWLGKPKPRPYRLWYYPGMGEDMAEEQIKLKKDMDLKIKEGRILDIAGLCDGGDYVDDCPFVGICQSPVRDKLIKVEYEEFVTCQK